MEDKIETGKLGASSNIEDSGLVDSARDVEDHAAALNQDIPADYFRSPRFLGTFFAGSIGLCGGVGSFALVAPILSVINNDIGPSQSYSWIAIINTLTLAVGFTLVGRLSDIFGRRWFVVSGNCLALVGCIVCSQAKSIPVLIGGNVMVGLAASVQQSVTFVIGELAPMKDRYWISAALYTFGLPPAAFGPAIAYGFVLSTSAGWRWCYYLLIITNAVSTLCYFFFYHPPTFHMLTKESRWQQVKKIDYIGLFLFTGGLVVFLLGLTWGGAVYPWASAEVIASLSTGGVGLIAFVLYECYASLAYPLVPMHLFRNTAWVVNVLVMALAASVYYGFSIVFPQMVFGIYTTDLRYGSLLCCAVTAGFLLGVVAAGMSRHIGKQKLQIVVCSLIYMPMLTSIACATTDNRSTVLGLLITGCIFVGYVEGCSVTSTGISLDNQAEIGTAIGVSSTIRALISTVATTIYVITLTNRLSKTIPGEVLPALASTNLPVTSYASFIASLATGNTATVEGLTPEILAAGQTAYREALILAFRTTFIVSVAFSGPALILAVFFPNLDSKMTKDVARTLHQSRLWAKERVISKEAR